MAGNVELSGVTNSRGWSVLAGENGASVDGVALGKNKRMNLSKCLWRRQPLEGGGRRRGGVED